jgi:hypothetical protein
MLLNRTALLANGWRSTGARRMLWVAPVPGPASRMRRWKFESLQEYPSAKAGSPPSQI